jgi:hypothetical protein
MIRVYCYLTDEHAHYLSLSNEDRRKVPNRKAILESLCLLADEDITEKPKPPPKFPTFGSCECCVRNLSDSRN